MQILYSIVYILCLCVGVFVFGRIYPREWLRIDRFPFRCYGIEDEGRIYNRIGIMRWKTKLPDISVIITRFIPDFMPRKRLDGSEKLSVLIEETCIAEMTHALAAVLGFGCVYICDGIGGWIISWLFLLANLPFIIMQRFNRPRLMKAEEMLKRRGVTESRDADECASRVGTA